MSRFWIAMAAFAAVGALEWMTLSPETIRVISGPDGQPMLDVSMRGAALALLAIFALRCWVAYRRDEGQTRRSGRE